MDEHEKMLNEVEETINKEVLAMKGDKEAEVINLFLKLIFQLSRDIHSIAKSQRRLAEIEHERHTHHEGARS